MRIVGIAAPFNSWSVDLGGFKEQIAPGAFSRTISDGHPVYCVHHHHMADVMGSTRSGTLRLLEDTKGLRFDLRLPETSLGRDIHELVKRGDLQSMSFSFFVNGAGGEHWEQTSTGLRRTLKDVSLLEISTVAMPAYPSSAVSARSLESSRNGAMKAAMTRRYMTARLAVA